jgi:phosphoglucosamine mutase
MTQYFGTDGIRAKVGSPQMTPEFILKLAMITGELLVSAKKNKKKSRVTLKVLIGRDTRRSGKLFEAALQAGFNAVGVDVYFLGVMPTPAVAYLTRAFHADLGVVISASHNLYQDNGIKFFSSEGRKISDEFEAAIEAGFAQDLPLMAESIGKCELALDAAGRYIEFCKSAIPHFSHLSDLKIIVDCAHGATAHIAPLVFEELGAEVISVGCQPDGLNINDQCGSTSPEKLCQAVKEHRADIGVAFDGDGDRVIMVNHQGEVVDGDEILYILALESQRNGLLKNSGVVGTQMSNLGLEQALARHQIPFARTSVGDRYVMEALHQKQWLIGGESSGHIIWLSSTTTGDGIVAALQVLSVMQSQQKSLDALLEDYEKAPQILINIPLKNSQGESIQISDQAWQELLQEAQSWNQKLQSSGRVLLRKSGTEPLIRVMVEGEKSEISKIAEHLRAAVLGKF